MNGQQIITEVSVLDLKKRLDAGEKVVVLDVREPHELAICALPYTLHIPMGQIPDRLSELAQYKNQEIVVYCRSGGRSGRVVQYLKSNDFKSPVNLHGGILAWADDVDTNLQKY